MSEAPMKEANADPPGEARWPMAGAVLAAMILILLLPKGERVGPAWLVPAIAGMLLVAVIVGDPGRIDRRSRTVRVLSIGLVAVLVLNSLWATGQLIDALINGGPETDSAEDLLAAGTVVWISNCLAFALLYWELDSGGAAARAHNMADQVDFAFPQQINPDLAPAGWHPRFVDYLYLGFTNATAFSPTDVLPLSAWAKLAMMAQSAISLTTVALVIARAVNVLS